MRDAAARMAGSCATSVTVAGGIRSAAPGGTGRGGRSSGWMPNLLALISTTRVILATAHRDHDPTNNRPRNLVAFCQRCHMLHDREEHRRRRWRTLFRRKALGDLFLGRYR